MRTRSATSVVRAGSRQGSLPEIRPAAILLMPSRPDPAAVVEQALADLTPGRVRTIEPDRIQALDLDAAETSIALDPEQFAGDLGHEHARRRAVMDSRLVARSPMRNAGSVCRDRLTGLVAPRSLPKHALNALRLQSASDQIPIASDAPPLPTSRGFLVWGFFCQVVRKSGKSFVLRQFFCSISKPFLRPEPRFADVVARRSCQGWPPRRPCGLLRACQAMP
jgi:hypothetical protein